MSEALPDLAPPAALPSEPAPVTVPDRTAALVAEVEALRAENARLKAVDRAKDTIWKRVGHELRTPLNFVTGFASILGDEIPGQLNRRQQDYVRKILDGADRILRLVDTFVDVAALEAGTFRLERRRTPLGPLIRDVLGTLRPLADHKLIRLVPRGPMDLAPVVDGPRIALALANLVSNAIKANPEGGVVEVRVVLTGARLVLEVEDRGRGLHADDVAKLLSREGLFAAPADGGGLGLGLAVSRRLVEAHGGCITVRSELGVGSVFAIELPAGG